MTGPTLTALPHCPCCFSIRIRKELRPCIGLESDGDMTYMVNGSVLRCDSCGHAWDRKASRGMGLKNYPRLSHQITHPRRPGFWTRLFQRLFPFT